MSQKTESVVTLPAFDVNGGTDTYAQAALRLQTNVFAVRTLVRDGRLKHVVIGHAHIIPHWAIAEFLRKQATDDPRSEERPARLRGKTSRRKAA